MSSFFPPINMGLQNENLYMGPTIAVTLFWKDLSTRGTKRQVLQKLMQISVFNMPHQRGKRSYGNIDEGVSPS